MAYADEKVASVAWLAGNVFYQLTQRMFQGVSDGTDLDAMDDAAILMQIATRYYTSQDADFVDEWAQIMEEREAAMRDGFQPEVHRRKALELRAKEIDAMFTSMVRMGQLAYQEPEASPWDLG